MPLAEEDPAVAEQAEWVDRLSRATGVFLGGGEPDRLLRLLYRQEALLYPVLQCTAGREAAGGRRPRCSRRDCTAPLYFIVLCAGCRQSGHSGVGEGPYQPPVLGLRCSGSVFSVLLCENLQVR